MRENREKDRVFDLMLKTRAQSHKNQKISTKYCNIFTYHEIINFRLKKSAYIHPGYMF